MQAADNRAIDRDRAYDIELAASLPIHYHLFSPDNVTNNML
jgi:hypothetical protein